MSKVSTAKKAGIVARVAARQLGRSRTGAAIANGLRIAGGHFGRVLHQLWLEVTGFTFLVLAAVGAFAGFHEYAKYQAGESNGPGRVILAVCFTISFAWFGVTSFWRVRRKG